MAKPECDPSIDQAYVCVCVQCLSYTLYECEVARSLQMALFGCQKKWSNGMEEKRNHCVSPIKEIDKL